MAVRQKTIKERVLDSLEARGPSRFHASEIADELGLEQRQVTTALHGLNDYGLSGGQLENVGKGRWQYNPRAAVPVVEGPRSAGAIQGREGHHHHYRWPIGIPRDVPIGWTTTVTVVSKRNRGGRMEYIAVTERGAAIYVEPIYDAEDFWPGDDTFDRDPLPDHTPI